MKRTSPRARNMAFNPAVVSRAWDILVIVTATLAGFILPLQLVLGLLDSGLFLYLNWSITLLFAADIFVRWRQSHTNKLPALPRGNNVTRARKKWLLVDGIAALPLSAMLTGTPVPLLRLLKLARVAQFMRQWRQQQLHNVNLLRLVFFAYWFILSAHWIACGWLALRGVAAEFDPKTNYVHALYWCITTLTTVGYGDITPHNNAQIVYAIATMIIGAGLYGYIIANVANILANINPARVHYLENMARLTAFMSYRNLPADLQKRIRDYHGYLWDKRLGYEESTVISALPVSLRTEVSLFLNRDIIERVPLFRGASEDFIRAIALQLRPMVFTPGDYVFKAGEHGEDMYFISRGTLEVLAKDGHTVLGQLSDGEFFGEIALLRQQPRTASVRAANYCDLYRLDKETFEHVLAHYPDIAEKIARQAQARAARDE